MLGRENRRRYNMVGRPPDVRALTELLIRALALLELQSAGKERRSRVTKLALRNYGAHTKNKPTEMKPDGRPRNANVRNRIHELTACDLKGCGTRTNKQKAQDTPSSTYTMSKNKGCRHWQVQRVGQSIIGTERVC